MGLKVTKVGVLGAVGCVLALGAVHVGMRHSLDSLLIDHARSTGMDWAHHIEVRLPALVNADHTDGKIKADVEPDVKRFNDLMAGILAVGNVHQIDFINADCDCGLSFGSHFDANGHLVYYVTDGGHNPKDGQHHARDFSEFANTKVEDFEKKAIQHLLRGIPAPEMDRLGLAAPTQAHHVTEHEHHDHVAYKHTSPEHTHHNAHHSSGHHQHASHENVLTANSVNPNHLRTRPSFEPVTTQANQLPHPHAHRHNHGGQLHGKPQQPANPGLSTKLLVDRGKVQKFFTNNHHTILIQRNNPVQQASIYAEVYHPVYQDGTALYMLRMVVGLDDKNAFFSTALYSGAGFVLLMIVASFAYPARKYFIVSQKQKRANEKAHYLANHDVLTGISNRNAFQHFAPKKLRNCAEVGGASYLMLIDIDGFKEINDYHGHQFGDEVLKHTASMLNERFGSDGFVARLGGDEFAILLTAYQMPKDEDTGEISFPKNVHVPLIDSDHSITVALSCGMAKFPNDGNNLSTLMQHADLALYAAKADDKSNLRQFDAQLGEAFKHRIEVLKGFREALENKQIVPFYQPVVGIHSKKVEGFEALARWQHPEKGLLTPAYFEDVFSDRELCADLGKYMIEAISADITKWRANNVPFEAIGINATEADLCSPTFHLNIISMMQRHKIKRGDLVIEVTENSIYGSNAPLCISRLEELKQAGCFIALDDFGTGYSSITHIKNLPVTAVKVDKSFIKKIVDDKADQTIVSSLVNMGQELNFKMLAEGVETKAQLQLVDQLGCDLAQGYHYAPAVSADQVPSIIDKLNKSLNNIVAEPAPAPKKLVG